MSDPDPGVLSGGSTFQRKAALLSREYGAFFPGVCRKIVVSEKPEVDDVGPGLRSAARSSASSMGARGYSGSVARAQRDTLSHRWANSFNICYYWVWVEMERTTAELPRRVTHASTGDAFGPSLSRYPGLALHIM